MTLATSKERFKEVKEAFIKLLDANPDLLTVKHWICDYRLQDFIDTGFENNLRRWMNIYKMQNGLQPLSYAKKIKQH